MSPCDEIHYSQQKDCDACFDILMRTTREMRILPEIERTERVAFPRGGVSPQLTLARMNARAVNCD